jgi:hypothetical protein
VASNLHATAPVLLGQFGSRPFRSLSAASAASYGNGMVLLGPGGTPLGSPLGSPLMSGAVFGGNGGMASAAFPGGVGGDQEGAAIVMSPLMGGTADFMYGNAMLAQGTPPAAVASASPAAAAGQAGQAEARSKPASPAIALAPAFENTSAAPAVAAAEAPEPGSTAQ